MLPSGDKRKRAGIQIPWEKKNGVARVSDTNAITPLMLFYPSTSAQAAAYCPYEASSPILLCCLLRLLESVLLFGPIRFLY